MVCTVKYMYALHAFYIHLKGALYIWLAEIADICLQCFYCILSRILCFLFYYMRSIYSEIEGMRGIKRYFYPEYGAY